LDALKKGVIMSINGIEITDVIIFPVRRSESEVKAFARIILNDQFVISGIKVYESSIGSPFIQFPKEYNKESGKGLDICFPVTAELRAYISDQVLTQYSLVTEAHNGN